MRLPISFELPPVSLGVGSGGGNSDAASGKISRISKNFQRSKQELTKFKTLWCGVAQLLWCGVAQLVARRLAVRQARVRFSARHHREGLSH